MRQASGISERGPSPGHDSAWLAIRPDIERATRQLECAAESCGNIIDPGQEYYRDDDRGAVHVDCWIAEVSHA